ncbi:hypothetical protein OXIME_001327 [Oxyplasma meridianum]|uniref:Uncharacterized protein n=1 Tax=Oxyplasma meridianum TaxID=3073602 RepID=A0AAX4NH39_9ARCH
MEREEFREILLQSLGGIKGGKTVRLTLVRSRNDLLLKKLKEMQYIDTRSIPFQSNYRFIVSSFTHGQYSRFRSDYWEDMDFLSVPYDDFTRILNTTEKYGFVLHGFSAIGQGRIQEDFPMSENGIALKNLNHYLSMGYYPYLLKLRKGKVSIQIRKDFNFFFRRSDEECINLIYDTANGIINRRGKLFDDLISLKLSTDAGGRQLDHIPSCRYKRVLGIEDMKIREIVRSVSGSFSISEGKNGSMIHYSAGEAEKSEGKILIDRDNVTVIPHWNSRMESSLRILEALKMGGAVTW